MVYKENEFKSIFKLEITNYLNEKELLNQKTRSLFFSLRSFDNFCYNLNIDKNILTKDLVLKWLEKNPNETFNNQSKRASILRCFGNYMYRYNKNNYILSKMLYPVKERYIPHIYTEDEIKNFFLVIDNLKPKCKGDNKPILCQLYIEYFCLQVCVLMKFCL